MNVRQPELLVDGSVLVKTLCYTPEVMRAW